MASAVEKTNGRRWLSQSPYSYSSPQPAPRQAQPQLFTWREQSRWGFRPSKLHAPALDGFGVDVGNYEVTCTANVFLAQLAQGIVNMVPDIGVPGFGSIRDAVRTLVDKVFLSAQGAVVEALLQKVKEGKAAFVSYFNQVIVGPLQQAASSTVSSALGSITGTLADWAFGKATEFLASCGPATVPEALPAVPVLTPTVAKATAGTAVTGQLYLTQQRLAMESAMTPKTAVELQKPTAVPTAATASAAGSKALPIAAGVGLLALLLLRR